MLGFISIILICHCIYSTLRWRKFLQGNSQPIEYVPIDVRYFLFKIIAEALFGLLLACVVIASYGKKLKKIHSFEQSIS